MTVRPPADAIVALRSFDRRFRAAFAEPDEGRSIDELAHVNGPDGRSALDHLVAATRTITFLGRALELTLLEDDPALHPAVVDVSQREWPDATGSVEDRLSELAWEANALADRAQRVPATDWARRARVAGHDTTVSAARLLWDAVDSVVEHLGAIEGVIDA